MLEADGEKYFDAEECSLCEEKAWASAESYNTYLVLPELTKLRLETIWLLHTGHK